MAEQLKPCPFCGGKAEMIWNTYHTEDCEEVLYGIRCTDVFCIGHDISESHYDTLEQAVEAWNRRAE